MDGAVAEVICIPSVSEGDRMNVQNYLSRKWGLPIGQNIGSVTNNWGTSGKFGNSSIDFDKTDNKAVRLSSGLSQDLTVCSLSFWVKPLSPDFRSVVF